MRRDVARAMPSAKARRAKPSAAAATDVRKTSSVRIAILKPSPSSPIRCAAGTRQPAKRSRASGCGAMTSIRSAIEKPGASRSTTNAVMPRAPFDCGSPGSPVRAKTT